MDVKVTITACTITKNSAPYIRRWIACMMEYADELIVVDLGSNDDTVKIAEACGVNVFSYSSQEDKATAMNFALDQAKGDWVIFVAPHEFFGCTYSKALREFLALHSESLGLALEYLYMNEKGESFERKRVLPLPIFRRESNIRYVGGNNPQLEFPRGDKFLFTKDMALYSVPAFTPDISACCITKDEEKNLPRWLENVKIYADEVIVVDTGSTDNTRKITRNDPVASLYSFKWINDFSAAKNYALDQSAADWVVFPDADEFFTDKTVHRLRGLLEWLHPQKDVGFIECRLVNIDENKQNIRDDTTQQRIFRCDKSIRYKGAIHEVALDSAKPERRILFVKQLEIHHTGYSENIIKRKMSRNLEMLQQKAKEKGKVDPKDYRYMMECYYGLEDYPKTVEYAKLIIREKQPEWYSHAYKVWISCTYKYENMAVSARVTEEAMSIFPKDSVFPMMRGNQLYQEGDYVGAENYLLRGLNLWEQIAAKGGKEAMTASLDRQEPVLCDSLGQIAYWRGNLAKALEYFTRSLYNNRLQPKVCHFLTLLHKMKFSDIEIIQKLNSIYDKEKDAAFLATHLLNRNSGKVYLYYARLAGYSLDDAAAYFAAGQYNVAAEMYASAIAHHAEEAVSANEELNTDAGKNTTKKNSQSDVLSQFNRETNRLFLTLLLLEKNEPQTSIGYFVYLPQNLQNVLQAYVEGTALDKTAWSAWRRGLAAIQTHADDALFTRYAALLADLPPDKIRQGADALFAIEAWEAAFSLYQLLPIDEIGDKKSFWENVGVCLFRLGENDAAKESLERAAEFGKLTGVPELCYDTLNRDA